MQFVSDLQHSKANFMRPILIDYLHPVLVQINEDQFNRLVEAFLNFRVADADLEPFAHVAFSVFVVYVSRMMRQQLAPHVIAIAQSILRMLPVLYEQASEMTVMGIDTFNYIVGQVEQIPMAAFARTFKEGVKELMKDAPRELEEFLLRIDPPAEDRDVGKPLFSDYRLEKRERSPEPTILEQPPPYDVNVFDLWFS
jgi:hypothetical protein